MNNLNQLNKKKLYIIYSIFIYLTIITTNSFAQINNKIIDQEPKLPIGLDIATTTDLTNPSITQQPYTTKNTHQPLEISGFAETIVGSRTRHDDFQKRMSIIDARLHLDTTKHVNNTTTTIVGDLLYDPIRNYHGINFSKGIGWLDLREINILFSPTTAADLKIGRQIITWGTGDLICINDLFPKDWNSFLIGRNLQYLKAPSNSIKLSVYNDLVNLDLVYNPLFNHDRYIDGERISYFRTLSNSTAGRNDPVKVIKKNQWFTQDEIAIRLHRLFNSYETAIYFYDGFWKSPGGVDPIKKLYTFPRLAVYGGSVRGPAFNNAIMYSEFGYYHSKDSQFGKKAGINHNQLRWLVGYQQEIQKNLTITLQYYLKSIQQYKHYYANLTNKNTAKDHHRHIVTINLTKKLLNDNLYLSLFNYYSTNYKDGYLRLNATYKVSDAWNYVIGGNLLYGNKDHTFFAQFRKNSNVYAGLRYGFNNN